MTDANEIDPSLSVTSHFDEATHIPFAQAEHFEREGFTGDELIPKSAKMGFTALQVNVYGEHPLKRIGRGNTRSYYVVNGEGTFVLNGEPRTVNKGDLVVIPAGSQYEYKGVMTLFEFNVSPGNTFKDKKIEPSKERPDVDRNPSDHHTANPQREAAAKALAAVLKYGYSLTNPEVKEVLIHYGYSPKSPAYSSVGSHGFRKLLAASGVKLETQLHKHREIFYDGNLPPEDTDIEKTKASIEAAIEARKKN